MRMVKRTIKSIMAKKGIKTGQLADLLDADANPTAVWLARDDGAPLNKLREVADALDCKLAFVDNETGAVYTVE